MSVYPPSLQPLVDRLRFVFRQGGREIGLTTDAELVREFAALGVSTLGYRRSRDAEHDEYEVYLPPVDELAERRAAR